jgi:hypothetical protein
MNLEKGISMYLRSTSDPSAITLPGLLSHPGKSPPHVARIVAHTSDALSSLAWYRDKMAALDTSWLDGRL